MNLEEKPVLQEGTNVEESAHEQDAFQSLNESLKERAKALKKLATELDKRFK